MKISIDWERPFFSGEEILQMDTSALDDFYAFANETNRLNLFFILEASFHRCLKEEKNDISARAAYLIAYYLFVPLTPPASVELAMYYIEEALRLCPLPEYETLRENIAGGN